MLQLKVRGPDRKLIIQSLRCEIRNKNDILNLCKFRSLSNSNNQLSQQNLQKKRNKHYQYNKYSGQQRKSIQTTKNQYFQQQRQKQHQHQNYYEKNNKRFKSEMSQLNYYRVIHSDKKQSEQTNNIHTPFNSNFRKSQTLQTVNTLQNKLNNKKFPQTTTYKNISLNQYIKRMMDNKKFKLLKSNLMKQIQRNDEDIPELELNGQEISFYKRISTIQRQKQKNRIVNNYYEREQKANQQKIKYMKYFKQNNKWANLQKYKLLEDSLIEQDLKQNIVKRLNTQTGVQQTQNQKLKNNFSIQIQKYKNYTKKAQCEVSLPEIQLLKNSLGPWDEGTHKFKERKQTKIFDSKDIKDNYIKKRKKIQLKN